MVNNTQYHKDLNEGELIYAHYANDDKVQRLPLLLEDDEYDKSNEYIKDCMRSQLIAQRWKWA